MLLMMLGVVVSVPLQIGFSRLRQAGYVKVVDWVTTSAFIADVLVQFRMGYITNTGEVVRDSRLIAIEYIRGMFVLDLISALPYRAFFSYGAGELVWLGLLKLPRLARLIRIFNSCGEHWRFFNALALGRLLVAMMIAIHASVCVWHYMAERLRGWPWIFDDCRTCDNDMTTYLYGFYHSFLLLLGDRPVASNNAERALIICLLYLGAFFYASVVGMMTLLVSNVWAVASRHKQRAAMMDDALRYRGVSREAREKVGEYFEYLAQYQHPGPDGVAFLQELPVGLYGAVMASMFGPRLARVQLFAHCEQPFLWRLAQRLRLSLFMASDVIYELDSVGHDMYIIWKGAVGLVAPDGGMAAVLGDGDHFGELGLMTANTPRPHRAVALRPCDVVMLSRWDLQEAMKDFPESAALVKERARLRVEDHEAHSSNLWAATAGFLGLGVGDGLEGKRHRKGSRRCNSAGDDGAAHFRHAHPATMDGRKCAFGRCGRGTDLSQRNTPSAAAVARKSIGDAPATPVSVSVATATAATVTPTAAPGSSQVGGFDMRARALELLGPEFCRVSDELLSAIADAEASGRDRSLGRGARNAGGSRHGPTSLWIDSVMKELQADRGGEGGGGGGPAGADTVRCTWVEALSSAQLSSPRAAAAGGWPPGSPSPSPQRAQPSAASDGSLKPPTGLLAARLRRGAAVELAAGLDGATSDRPIEDLSVRSAFASLTPGSTDVSGRIRQHHRLRQAGGFNGQSSTSGRSPLPLNPGSGVGAQRGEGSRGGGQSLHEQSSPVAAAHGQVPAIAAVVRREVNAVAERLADLMDAALQGLLSKVADVSGRVEDLVQQVLVVDDRLERIEEAGREGAGIVGDSVLGVQLKGPEPSTHGSVPRVVSPSGTGNHDALQQHLVALRGLLPSPTLRRQASIGHGRRTSQLLPALSFHGILKHANASVSPPESRTGTGNGDYLELALLSAGGSGPSMRAAAGAGVRVPGGSQRRHGDRPGDPASAVGASVVRTASGPQRRTHRSLELPAAVANALRQGRASAGLATTSNTPEPSVHGGRRMHRYSSLGYTARRSAQDLAG
ncbi:hypothetical protein GPECTOR_3g95 [Gonium pectorale]|uniref:Cyclic nucleotide-binding domain-containing protein n=1 Tax=Gonium pectorale TaxID=33097 RepID=A0A150GZV4_GONPE|nr:hypothetical protein GPECTOR_3g95 [Gonium pectorale]|eukprot:KXZ55446.1 hypothetical protein GPECTOR_3g95 [Gonium pectorale]